ncbi:GspH/FimT family pseudopilin [Candidatus Zixiibacteriota bacterium]
MNTANANQRGITLMELMIVVVTIGIMAAMATPRFLDYIPKLKTKSAVREVVSQIRLARSAAIAEKTPMGIYFCASEEEYIVFADTVDVGSCLYDETDQLIRTKEFPPEIELGYNTFDDNVVIFAADGSASSSGSVTFLSPAGAELYEVSVLAGTGKVKMQEVDALDAESQ